jgi:hypothetical protein
LGDPGHKTIVPLGARCRAPGLAAGLHDARMDSLLPQQTALLEWKVGAVSFVAGSIHAEDLSQFSKIAHSPTL